LLKPVDNEKLLSAIDSAMRKAGLDSKDNKNEVPTEKRLNFPDAFEDIITRDKKMMNLFYIIEKYAQADNSVLIWGESGTGKELIAKAIHQISDRKDKKFIAVNAGSFANDLFVSEFFGHSKGAFTGANTDKKGFIEMADGGTLFLDEIGELSVPIQVKLLRFLQEEEFYRLGSTENIKSNVRIIAATNKNLFEEIKNGNFRKDLFFRLNIHSINLPPLRERTVDIIHLAEHFLKLYNKKYDKNVKGLSKAVKNYLQSYSFPGNIRELKNIINSSIIVEPGVELTKKSLPHYLLETNSFANELNKSSQPSSLKDMEKSHIKKVLQFAGNNRTKAAEILKISRVSLINKIKKFGLSE
jgi:transcriptional regulator with PAS, ATPase and Fis domain